MPISARPKNIFYSFGEFVYRLRWLVVVFWLFVILFCVPFVPHLMEPFKAIGFNDPNSQSEKANQLLNEKLGYNTNRFIVIYNSHHSFETNPNLFEEIKSSLKDLDYFPIKHQIIFPTLDNKQVSKDKHTAYAVILVKGNEELDSKTIHKFKSALKKPKNLTMHVGGSPIFIEDVKKQTQVDMYKSEYIATPVAIITMLVVFESVIAASLPIILGGIGAFIILMTLFFIGHLFTLSVFTLNIALLLGLCLSLDYSLLIVSRYRDELNRGRSAREAIAFTQATAGKAVFFSGAAVFISLSALLLFPINVLFSVGVGGLAAVSISVLIAVLLLPAILSILHQRINLLPIKIFNSNEKTNTNPYWHRSVTRVVKHPGVFFCVILALLLLLGYPFTHAKFGISTFRILPETSESRKVFDIFEEKFGENQLAPVITILKTKHGENILTKRDIGYLYEYTDRLKQNPNVLRIDSIVNTEPRLTKSQYEMLYTEGKDRLDPNLKKLLQLTTNDGLTSITVISRYRNNTEQTNKLIQDIRDAHTSHDLAVEVTGDSANTLDLMKSISHIFPYAFLWIVGFTYVILLILLRSITLPLKAILTTILSLCASYGLLVIIFQDGYLHDLLNFEPQGMLDISLLIIIFCALFGVSMDYEVFLLTRIKEYYERTKDNTDSIIFGIERSSKIITSAAIIVILLCFSFMAADVLIVKAFGMGIAVAVFIDAFIIRTLFVPATMTLLGKWNWYAPKWLKRILPIIDFDPEKYHGRMNKK